jgi:glycosyltransferase involved in cell wall biosynthesis
MPKRIVALLASYNNERFIANCLDNLIRHGVEAYLIDDSSSDRTVAIAEGYLGKGLIGIETFPREVPHEEGFPWAAIRQRKAELATILDGDWFIHMDPDEVRLPRRSSTTLSEALTEVDAQGYNAVNFLEFVFVPTRESPNHDHPDYERTMRWYYPFMKQFPHRLNAWKRQPTCVDLASTGHRVSFPELRMFPESFFMRHYLFLSREQAAAKYGPQFRRTDSDTGVDSRKSADRTAAGSWRVRLDSQLIQLPSQADLREYISDDLLDFTDPRDTHVLESATPPKASGRKDRRPREFVRGTKLDPS